MKPDIFKYSDYRVYLKDFYAHRKSSNDNFSYRHFAKKAGFTSPNFLQLVINGKRNLTRDSVVKFSNALELNKKERFCFEALVFLNQSVDADVKRYYLELLHNLKNGKIGTMIRDDQFEYMSNWFFPVVRELVALPYFQEDPVWIRQQLGDRITTAQAKESIAKLLELNLITRDDKGRLLQVDDEITTGQEVRHIISHKFHQQMLSLAKETLSKIRSEKRDVSAMTMAVSEKQFAELKRMINEFEGSVARLLSSNPDVPNSVCQLNIQFFPLTVEQGRVKDE